MYYNNDGIICGIEVTALIFLELLGVKHYSQQILSTGFYLFYFADICEIFSFICSNLLKILSQ